VTLLTAIKDGIRDFKAVKKKADDICRKGLEVEMTNLVFHSVFKSQDNIVYPHKPEHALVSYELPDRETAKKKGLETTKKR
jgi:hypothetical protein